MPGTITEHRFRHGGINYFRGAAENIDIAAHGDKHNPLGAGAYLSVHGRVRRSIAERYVRYVTTVPIDWERESKRKVDAAGKIFYFPVIGSSTRQADYEQAARAELVLAKFVIDEGNLIRMLNEADTVRDAMRDEGKDARVVSQVWVAMEGELSERFDVATQTGDGVTAFVDHGVLKATAETGSRLVESSTITLAPGTTFAYLMHKVTKWSRGKEHVERVEDDQKGIL